MQNFQGIVFILAQTYRAFFKSALVYFKFKGQNYKSYWKISMNFSQIFQIPGLRKINIANSQSTFDENKYNIHILR